MRGNQIAIRAFADGHMAAVEIDPSTICVTFARPAGLEVKSYSETLVTLSDDEIGRVERFLFVASRALLRRTLSRFVNVEPGAWRFDTDLHGRPYIVFPTEGRMLRFSASRTDGLGMCAVALNRDVGADVECLRGCPLDVVDGSFAPVEAQLVRERSGIEQSERFFTYWTLKESYVKARGLGLSIPLDKVAFQLSDGQPPVWRSMLCWTIRLGGGASVHFDLPRLIWRRCVSMFPSNRRSTCRPVGVKWRKSQNDPMHMQRVRQIAYPPIPISKFRSAPSHLQCRPLAPVHIVRAPSQDHRRLRVCAMIAARARRKSRPA